MLLEVAVIYLHDVESTVRNPDPPFQAGWEDNELIHREMSSVTSERFMPSGKTFSSELSGGKHLNLGFDMDFLFLKGHF